MVGSMSPLEMDWGSTSSVVQASYTFGSTAAVTIDSQEDGPRDHGHGALAAAQHAAEILDLESLLRVHGLAPFFRGRTQRRIGSN